MAQTVRAKPLLAFRAKTIQTTVDNATLDTDTGSAVAVDISADTSANLPAKLGQRSSRNRALLGMALVVAGLAVPLLIQTPPPLLMAVLLPVSVIASRLVGWRRFIIGLAVITVACIALLGLAVFMSRLGVVDAALVGLSTLASFVLVRLPHGSARGPRGLRPETADAVYNTLLQAVPVVLLNKKGDIIRASRAAAALFERSVSNLETLHFAEIIPGFICNQHASLNCDAGLIPPPSAHWQALPEDKPAVPVDLWLEHTPEGPLIRLIDLSPHHAADAQARELHSQLNKVWRLNSLGEMAATLAHELNQPLGAAASYLHAAQEDMKRAGPLGMSASRTADLAKAQMLRAGQIIRRMRELLTMEMRTLSTEKVRNVVEDVLPILTLTGQEKSVHISVDIDSPDNVRMDRIQFQQALVNLVRNAVEASPADTRVLITGRIISDHSYEIAVEDSGPGIAPDQVERVFQPMTTTKTGGMGLGLSVTRTIVESHGGNLRVGTSRWNGARFSFTLKTATVDVDE